jgi:hypothetical protein
MKPKWLATGTKIKAANKMAHLAQFRRRLTPVAVSDADRSEWGAAKDAVTLVIGESSFLSKQTRRAEPYQDDYEEQDKYFAIDGLKEWL